MSDQERMDRARRIRQMREGNRATANEENEADDSDEPTESPTEETPADETEGDEAATETAGDATAELDDEVAAAVERVAGATATVPDPEEMSESGIAEDDADSGPGGDTDGSDPDVADSGAETAVGSADTAESTDVEPAEDAEEGEAVGLAAGATGRTGLAAGARQSTADTRVLEFTLGDEQYCLDIEYVEEIVKDERITRVPNTPEFVEGVVDLRGQITTILNPKLLVESAETDPGELLVVFDGEKFDDQGHLGWVVDDVRQVAPVTDDQVNDPPVAEDYIQGVIDREDDDAFVVWTSPDLALEEAI